MDEETARAFKKNFEILKKEGADKGIISNLSKGSKSDKELRKIVGDAKFDKMSDSRRQTYKKAYGIAADIVKRVGPKLALAALSGPAGWLAAGIPEAAAATPAGAGEDQLLYKTRRKKVPGGGPDEADIKRERSNKYAKGGVAKGFKGHF